MAEAAPILIIDECHPLFLEKIGVECCAYRPEIDLAELGAEIEHVKVLVMRSKLRLTKDWIDKGYRLQAIVRLGSGMDNIDVSYAEDKGIDCINVPEGNRDAVAEQTIGMLLSMLHNVSKAQCEVRDGLWTRAINSGEELGAKVVGIIGYGNVGTALAERLASFGCKILAYDLFKSNFGNETVQEVSLAYLKENAEVVSVHVPLNKWSYEMINRDFINSFREPIYLLNLSRGDVVKSEDLVQGLLDQKIKGLALDVFENEKLATLTADQKKSFDFLSRDLRVIFTPHIGGLTRESFRKTAEIAADKLIEKGYIKSIC